MKIVYTILFFTIYHYVLLFFLRQINNSKLMFYIKKTFALSMLLLGGLIPILILSLILNFEDIKSISFIVAISLIYMKFFFNYKIQKNDSTK